MKRVISICAMAALAACAAQQSAPDYAATARDLDQARAEIAPPLGATTYTLDSRRLLDQPGGENRSLAGSLLQLPGVSLGPNGQVHVRGQ
jgi:outer membrane receptor for ferrienterochelin and colicins